jgi:hypothetical protein
VFVDRFVFSDVALRLSGTVNYHSSISSIQLRVSQLTVAVNVYTNYFDVAVNLPGLHSGLVCHLGVIWNYFI